LLTDTVHSTIVILSLLSVSAKQKPYHNEDPCLQILFLHMRETLL